MSDNTKRHRDESREELLGEIEEFEREREQLKVMSITMLNDIGITRAEADSEAMRSDIPHERLIALE